MNAQRSKEAEERVREIAGEVFAHLSRVFPVMCSSDEFHFLPRLGPSPGENPGLDSLDADLIEELLGKGAGWARELKSIDPALLDIETEADRRMLLSSLAAIDLDFGLSPVFRHEPVVYLKIAGIGLAQSLDMGTEVLDARLADAPRLLQEARANLAGVPGLHLEAAKNMAEDLGAWLAGEFGAALKDKSQALSPRVSGLFDALREFKTLLLAQDPAQTVTGRREYLMRLLGERFFVARDLGEIFAIGLEELNGAKREMESLAQEVDGSSDWQSLYWGHLNAEARATTLAELFTREMERLREFFMERGMVDPDEDVMPRIEETPLYLRSVRCAASYAAPPGNKGSEGGIFYLLTGGARATDPAGSPGARLAREYKYLAAHETYPGHHVLDSHRVANKNPVRAAVESPLFYEGWATYAESILPEEGYIEEPVERLAAQKRRAWRAARLLIDARDAKTEDKIKWLGDAGFTEDQAAGQISRYRLTRGYQLCYTLGCWEIERLKESHGPKLGTARFHREVLTAGQMDFDLLDMRLRLAATDAGTE